MDKSLITFSGMLALATALGFLAPLYWFFDLFSHFRIQLLAVALVLLFVSLAGKRKIALILLAALLLVNLGAIAVPAAKVWSGFPAIASKHTIRILSANVHIGNPSPDALLELIHEHKPDIFVGMEIDARWAELLSVLKKDYPYEIVEPREDAFGIALFSRIPVQGKVVPVGGFNIPPIEAETAGQKIIAAHPVPPIDPHYAANNQDYIRILAGKIAGTDKPVIVAGDFNATLWSHAIKPMRAVKGLKEANYAVAAWTWPSFMLPLAISIDHVFYRGLNLADFQVLPAIGSDHFPLLAEFSVP